MFVATKLGDKNTHVVVAKYFGATNIILARQGYICRSKRRVCRDKTFVAAKMILVAAPASDSGKYQTIYS